MGQWGVMGCLEVLISWRAAHFSPITKKMSQESLLLMLLFFCWLNEWMNEWVVYLQQQNSKRKYTKIKSKRRRKKYEHPYIQIELLTTLENNAFSHLFTTFHKILCCRFLLCWTFHRFALEGNKTKKLNPVLSATWKRPFVTSQWEYFQDWKSSHFFSPLWWTKLTLL